jgi:DtxR family Mn-dependent transcriptional regulator
MALGTSKIVGVTEQMEEYLETIYRIELEGKIARTGNIAKQLNVAPASVTDMIQKLEKLALIEYEPYKGVNLTDPGRILARRQLEKHRVMQAFLQEICNMEHAEAHDAACGMEHSIPPALENWMAAYLEKKMGKPFDVGRKVKDQIA